MKGYPEKAEFRLFLHPLHEKNYGREKGKKEGEVGEGSITSPSPYLCIPLPTLPIFYSPVILLPV